MIQVCPMRLMHGLPIVINEHCSIRQPQLKEIDAFGYDRYRYVLSTFLVKKTDLLKTLGAEDGPEFDAYSVYDMMIAIPELRATLMESLGFFVVEPITYKQDQILSGGYALSKTDLEDISEAVMQLSYIEHDSQEQHQFASEKARRIWEKCQKGKAQMRKASKQDINMELPNLIGAVAARSGGYTLLNIWDLTVYQLYDQFTRTNVNVQMDIYASRWAAWGKDDFDVAMWFKNISKKEG